jgi:protein-S-isoprenylcysteine O-methyltransferase Ste14
MRENERLTRLVQDGGASVKRSSWLLPPTIAVVAIAAIIVLHILLPIVIVVRAPGSYAGSLLFATGVAMVVWSRRAFQAVGTPIKPFTGSTVLIRHGLYRWSRNPMYLGAVLLIAGVAILLGSLGALVVVIAFFLILQHGFICREERLLDETFGERYRSYRRSVRRWL